MTKPTWPDLLQPPDPIQIQQLLDGFWVTISKLAELIPRNEHLLAEEVTSQLRNIVLDMMLALNGIQRPVGTIHLNGYLGESQQRVLEKTLVAPSVSGESWLGRAVALTVIYHWYAPQLVEKFEVAYPQKQESQALSQLQDSLPDWPLSIQTE